MEAPAIGWIAAILIGALAGWLAEKLTRSNMGLITNIVLGMIGASFGSWLFGRLGIRLDVAPWLAYLAFGLIGACILIIATRLIAPARWR
jgi:uncharacterized membrane protein YeaQ/YmgE (transglycosylase-associated protein family)